jgi:hypothetical protein
MRLEPVPPKALFPRLESGKFDAFLFEMTSGRTLTWPYDWWRSRADQLVATGYSSADAALDRMRAAGTDEEVRIAVADVIRVLREDPPALFLVWPYDSRAADTTFTIPHQPERDIFGTLWQAQPTVPGAKSTP